MFGTRTDDSHSKSNVTPRLKSGIAALEATDVYEHTASERRDDIVMAQNNSKLRVHLTAPVLDQESLCDSYGTIDDGLVESVGSMNTSRVFSLNQEIQNTTPETSYTTTLKGSGSGDTPSHHFSLHLVSSPIPVHEVSDNHRKTMDFLLSSASDSTEGSLFDL